MENVAHWTQQSTADFVYSISSTFVAQIETKMEKEDISRSEIAIRLKKSSGRVSQILNNPGNLSLRVMVETARSLGLKVGVIAYDDRDPTDDNGPIDPDVFVKCWERAGRPANLFELEDVSACDIWEGYSINVAAADLSIYKYGANIPAYIGIPGLYPTVKTTEPVNVANVQIGAPQVSNPTELWQTPPHGFLEIWHHLKPTTLAPDQENAA
jgi:transcriptional regulator with XRE-family HTH domain